MSDETTAALGKDPARCPRCDSPDPAKHPAVQAEGEVTICQDSYHAPATARPATPETDKLIAAAEGSQAIGEFLEWLGEQGTHLARYGGSGGDVLLPYHPRGGINGLLATYFEIDLDKVEQERRALLQYVRSRP